MGAIVAALGWIGRFLISGKVKAFAFFSYISSNFLTFFVAFQFIVWIGSAILTLLLAFYGTEILSSIFDITGIKDYVGGLMNQINDFGSQIDVSGNAFGTNIQSALNYFHFFDFLNLITSLWFGIFSLKLNILVWRATRFNSAKGGLMSMYQQR